MTEIYIEISKLTDKFRTMAYGLTTDENKINEAVQELMLYFLQANPETIRNIYEKDGILGITRYGAVALRRALRSKRSSFYYKYEKYYTHIDRFHGNVSQPTNNIDSGANANYYKALSNVANEEIDNTKLVKLEMIDKELDKLSWYDKQLFELYYYEDNTLDSLSAKTNISRNSIYTTIDKVRTIIKKELNEDV